MNNKDLVIVFQGMSNEELDCINEILCNRKEEKEEEDRQREEEEEAVLLEQAKIDKKERSEWYRQVYRARNEQYCPICEKFLKQGSNSEFCSQCGSSKKEMENARRERLEKLGC